MFGNVDVNNVFKITALHTAFEEKFHSSYYFNGEYHNFWEMVIVLEGKLGVTAGSDIFQLKKGQAVIHEPMEFHRLWSEGDSQPKIIVFSFSALNMPEYFSKVFEIADTNIPIMILSSIKSAFETKDYNVTGIKDTSNIDYQLSLKRLELFILDRIPHKTRKGGNLESQTAKNYTAIVNILEDNMDKRLSVSDIAELSKMSQINLKKTFSRYSGMGVMEYFNQLKINAAIPMLKNGLSVQETALSLGFLNQNYFSTVFKRITGKSPSHYR